MAIMVNEHVPFLSVRLITYNHEKYISSALDGILLQKTEFPIEVVIGDDCSTDGTSVVIAEYQTKFPELIRVLHRDKHMGMVRNGIETFWSCRGKYIALLDGDDYWTDPYKLHKQVAVLEEEQGRVICFHNTEVRYEDSSRHSTLLCRTSQKITSGLLDLAERNYIPTSSVVMRNDLIGEFPEWYYDLPFSDWALYILNAQHGDIHYIPQVMGVYRRHSDGVWSSLNKIEGRKQNILFLDMIMENLSEDKVLYARLKETKKRHSDYLRNPDVSKTEKFSLKTWGIDALIHFLNRLR
jgi:glycosyltransferase involved in cell wall biosynthesis